MKQEEKPASVAESNAMEAIMKRISEAAAYLKTAGLDEEKLRSKLNMLWSIYTWWSENVFPEVSEAEKSGTDLQKMAADTAERARDEAYSKLEEVYGGVGGLEASPAETKENQKNRERFNEKYDGWKDPKWMRIVDAIQSCLSLDDWFDDTARAEWLKKNPANGPQRDR